MPALTVEGSVTTGTLVNADHGYGYRDKKADKQREKQFTLGECDSYIGSMSMYLLHNSNV